MARRSKTEARAVNVSDLAQEKVRLDSRAVELTRRAFLTPDEQTELSAVKKRKLALKDQLHAS
ncbi:MAG: hypothetical protein Q8Q09_12645 [Deltaproteobacteria bacterium]|nr:hypothetical protein [Deltaproteobacteria bacterium]